ncbi:unnamed protein product [Timema podura]|uniref:Adenosine deaminase domain-containing protein n=1 Tax=Timema podura TaxID=61482 RepID=A0ABN7NJE4_TIMPD|nr:unnamed protein product [Timema podura]
MAIPKPSEVKAILEFKPERIGHGTCIHPHLGGSSELWEILLQSKIPVEACLTSNVKSSTVKHYEDHHFQFMFKHQHPITLGVSSKCYTFVTSISNRPFGVVVSAPYYTLPRKTTLGTPDQDLNLDLPVIGSLVYCESSTLDYAGIEAESRLDWYRPGTVAAQLLSVWTQTLEDYEHRWPLSSLFPLLWPDCRQCG